jgi:hypothetical protein
LSVGGSNGAEAAVLVKLAAVCGSGH